MTTFYGNKAKSPAFMPVDGCGIQLVDSIHMAANFTDGDLVNLLRVPAGTELGQLKIRCDDLDSDGAPAIVFSVGYAPADAGSSLSAVADYFAAAGQTTAQAGGTLDCSFEPIRFEEDCWITLTVATKSATFAAGDIYGIGYGAAVGPSGTGSTGAM
ncbi:MAG TPA: hypothetical protein VKD22_05570 [Ramlibacter sp.]|nr:hypothetical protein [Ramlibacter sp.]